MEHAVLSADIASEQRREPADTSPGSNSRAGRLMAMGQMAASLAHEIRNPLGSMELFCSLLKKDLQDEPQKLQLAEHIHQGIKALDRIISNCLQFARDVKPQWTAIDNVESYLQEIILTASGKYGENSPAVSLEVFGQGPGFADPYQLGQALLNVLLNAFDADVQKNSVGTNVTLKSDLRNSQIWKISVQDQGQGMEQQVTERAFDPFFTTKTSGTGLGLAVVHTIVSAHGGNVQISSTPGVGTTVTVEIPRQVNSEH